MESNGNHVHSARASTNQNDHQPGRTQDINHQSKSKRHLEADNGKCRTEPVANLFRIHRQPAKEHAAAVMDLQRSDSTATDDGNMADIASLECRLTATRSKKVCFHSLDREIKSAKTLPKDYAQDFGQNSDGEWMLSATPCPPTISGKPWARKGQSDKPLANIVARDGQTTESSSSQPHISDGYYPFLASPSPKEKEWSPKEDKYLLDAAERRENFATMSRTLICSEQACRNRIAHLVKVLQNQLERRSMILDEELLDEMKKEIEQQSRESGGEFLSELEHEFWSDEEREDDETMKLVIWKFYQRCGALDHAVMETHEGMREELDELEWISPQLLEVAAKMFIKRRADKCIRVAQGGRDVADE